MLPENPEPFHINTAHEKSLHAALKRHYAQPGDRLEVEVDGCIIDIVRDSLLIEIQTGNFSALKSKLAKLIDQHPVRVVYPVAQSRWIVKIAQDGRVLSKRKSPKRGTVYHVFSELVYIAPFITHPNFSLEVVLVQDEEIRRDDGKGSWRRGGWSIDDRRLLSVLQGIVYDTPQAFLDMIPPALPTPFTTANLANAIGQSRPIARKMLYCLKHSNIVEQVGKQGRAPVYRVCTQT